MNTEEVVMHPLYYCAGHRQKLDTAESGMLLQWLTHLALPVWNQCF